MIAVGTSGLAAAYVVLATLLFALLRDRRWPWPVKAGLGGAVVALCVLTAKALPTLLGWPTHAVPPARFNLLAVHVQEPNKASGDPGGIYLWAADMAAGAGGAAPRAYRLPFGAELQTRVTEAGNKMRKGLPQLGEARVSSHNRAGETARSVLEIEFFDVPDPLFPEQ